MPTFVTPTTYTPSSNNSWNTIDCSALVPAGAAGVLCYVVAGGGDTEVGVRKNGSTDNLTGFLGAGGFTTTAIGIDGSRLFQAYKAGSGENPTIVVYGYFTSAEATFFTNATPFTLGAAYAWTDCDITSISTGALAAIGFVRGSNDGFSCRKNGSTDDRVVEFGNFGYGGFLVGVDASKIFEANTANGSDVVHVTGYVTANITTYTNGIDRTPGTTGSYQTLSALPAGAIAGLYEVAAAGSSALRKNADSLDIYGTNGKVQRNHVAQCDASRICEAKISASGVTIYEMGYFTAGGGGSIIPKIMHHRRMMQNA